MTGAAAILAVTLSVVTQPSTPPSGDGLAGQYLQDAVNHLPHHVRITHDGKTYSAFELEPYKQLLVISYDHLLFEQAEKAYRNEISHLEQMTSNLEQVNKSYQKSLEILAQDHSRLLKKWEEENKARHLAEAKAASPYPWVVLGIGGGVAGAGALGVGYDRSNPWAWGAIGVGAGLAIIGLIDGLL